MIKHMTQIPITAFSYRSLILDKLTSTLVKSIKYIDAREEWLIKTKRKQSQIALTEPPEQIEHINLGQSGNNYEKNPVSHRFE